MGSRHTTVTSSMFVPCVEIEVGPTVFEDAVFAGQQFERDVDRAVGDAGVNRPNNPLTTRSATIIASTYRLTTRLDVGRAVPAPARADPEGTPAFDVSIGEQLIEFIGYRFQGEHANEIINAIRHSATDSYDPQISERFA
ncbi:hypothetical protein [Rhodococcus erythropolis]|uniref:Uncharacterized protein n=1 Tax=Rhodococcus erythropolis TaxID=1833 RepID=A0AAX3ZYE1_RHOER|nr:hypothetical protein [Rhodococcus erythropolis]WMN01925.1 hypothetical protein QIE55_32025 [Rhodococcus erythropolis]